MEVLTGHNWTLYVADCRAAMAVMPERSVHCVVSSPPYWGLRDYGISPVDWADGERCVFGLESAVQGYIRHTLEIFDGLRRVLRDDGVIWWNIGDSFYTAKGACNNPGGGSTSLGQNRKAAGAHPSGRAGGGRMAKLDILAGNKLLIPHRVAIALQDAGWVIRQDNVWAKRSPMPESVTGWRWVRCQAKVSPGGRAGRGKARMMENDTPSDVSSAPKAEWDPCPGCWKCEATDGYILRRGSWRTTNAHEFIFMVTKGGEYFADGDAVAEPATLAGSGRTSRVRGEFAGKGCPTEGREPFRAITETRNPRSVWMLSNEPFKGAHFACFPTAIPKRCVQASTSAAGVCPACGSQYAPIVETSRVPTRPGVSTKVYEVPPIHPDSPSHRHSGDVCGNRDPQRHTTVATVHGYRATCDCNAGEPVPSVVFDPFNGSGTTGQVAVSLGRRYVGCEINPTYARELAAVRIETPLPDKTKPAKKRSRRHKHQKQLFTS